MYDPVIGRWTTQDPAIRFLFPISSAATIRYGTSTGRRVDTEAPCWEGIFNLTMDLLSGNLNKDSQMVRMGSFIRYRCHYGCVGFLCRVQVWRALVQAVLNGLGTGFITGFSGRFLSQKPAEDYSDIKARQPRSNGLNQRLSNGLVGAAIGGIVKRHSCRNSGKKFLERCRKDKQNYRRQTKKPYPTGRSRQTVEEHVPNRPVTVL